MGYLRLASKVKWKLFGYENSCFVQEKGKDLTEAMPHWISLLFFAVSGYFRIKEGTYGIFGECGIHAVTLIWHAKIPLCSNLNIKRCHVCTIFF